MATHDDSHNSQIVNKTFTIKSSISTYLTLKDRGSFLSFPLSVSGHQYGAIEYNPPAHLGGATLYANHWNASIL
jgi:hypothetical protein